MLGKSEKVDSILVISREAGIGGGCRCSDRSEVFPGRQEKLKEGLRSQ